MSVFFIANVTVKQPENFQEYAKSAAESMAPFGGEILRKGSMVRQLAGEQPHQMVAIVSFPDAERLDKWYESETYQALIPLRDKAADVVITAFDAL